MKRWQWPTGLALGCILFAAAAQASVVGAQDQSLSLTLRAQNDSGISGTATFTDTGDGKTRVAIQVTGAGSGPQPAHIHAGTCDELDPTPAFTLSDVSNGSSTTDVDSTLQQLTATPHAVHLHKSPDELAIYVACADVMRPATLPRSGDPGPDPRAIAAGLAGLMFAALGLGLRRRSQTAP
ncbi:MAG: hypothetical protein JO023_11485 [Chloroflexi bacterium]|nr:hypothetical protein [Chloroflexota bacterium]